MQAYGQWLHANFLENMSEVCLKSICCRSDLSVCPLKYISVSLQLLLENSSIYFQNSKRKQTDICSVCTETLAALVRRALPCDPIFPAVNLFASRTVDIDNLDQFWCNIVSDGLRVSPTLPDFSIYVCIAHTCGNLKESELWNFEKCTVIAIFFLHCHQ